MRSYIADPKCLLFTLAIICFRMWYIANVVFILTTECNLKLHIACVLRPTIIWFYILATAFVFMLFYWTIAFFITDTAFILTSYGKRSDDRISKKRMTSTFQYFVDVVNLVLSNVSHIVRNTTAHIDTYVAVVIFDPVKSLSGGPWSYS